MNVQTQKADKAKGVRCIDNNKNMAAARLAIATFWVPAAKYNCALLLWCRSAHRLSGALREGQPLIIVGEEHTRAIARHEDCEAEYVRPTPALTSAVRAYSERHSRRQLADWALRSTLLKLHLFALTQFELVFFTDLDVDPLGDLGRPWVTAEKVVGTYWHAATARFLASPFSVVWAHPTTRRR